MIVSPEHSWYTKEYMQVFQAALSQEGIIYLMHVRIRRLLDEVDAINGTIKITVTEPRNLISVVEEFKSDNLCFIP